MDEELESLVLRETALTDVLAPRSMRAKLRVELAERNALMTKHMKENFPLKDRESGSRDEDRKDAAQTVRHIWPYAWTLTHDHT